MANIGLINNSTILKPATSSPSLLDDQTPNSSSNSQVLVPLTIFDKAAIDRHVKVLYAFKAPMPSNEVMKEALSRVLLHFPHLAGRFAIDGLGRTCIHLNNEGVRVIETHIQATFENQLPFDPSSELGHLIPPVAGNIEQLLQIQLNRYSCGGLVIGQTAHHRVADGQSMSSFFVAWAKLVRGMDLYPLPYHGRGAIPVPRNPPRVEFAHHSIEFQKTATPDTPRSLSPIENLVTHFSNEFLNRIKEKIVEENNTPKRYSTFECLLAHVWKKVTQARGLDLEESTQIRVAVNGRARIKLAVPMEYFGNLVLWAYPKLKVSEVLKGSHTSVAMTIHEAVTKVDNKYFQSFIDFGEVTKDDAEELEATAPEIGNSLCPNLEVDSWLRFEFHDLDFGGGGPCAFFPANIQVEGLLIFFPSCREGGGVDVVMTLLPEHVPLFRQISHSLNENLSSSSQSSRVL